MAYFAAATATPTQKRTPQGTIPQLPTYLQPGSNAGLARESDFYAANKYQDPYGDYVAKTGKYAGDLLGGAMKASPFAGGSDWGGAMAKFGGGGFPDIEDPATIRKLGLHMANLSGDRTRMLVDAARRLSSSRAGNQGGPVGGIPQETADYGQAMNVAANQYRGDYTQGMGYLYKDAEMEANARAQLADLLKAQFGTGATMSGQELQALKYGDEGQQNWNRDAGAAYGRDVNTYNTAAAGDYDKQMARAGMQRQQSEQEQIDQLLKAVTSQGPLNPWEEGGNPLSKIYEYLFAKKQIPQVKITTAKG